jgi:DNA-3-methyladenine glycosylase
MDLPRLPRAFYDRDTATVARELLGCRLFRRGVDGVIVETRIVETEGYLGPHDLACHTARGRTPRTEVMFGPPGHAYVYLIYGMYACLNCVTEAEGHGSAVLIRAVEPVVPATPSVRLDGPGRLTRGLRIDRADNGTDLVEGDALFVAAPERPVVDVASGPRVGVDYAGEWAAAPLRFWEAGNPRVSPIGAARIPRRRAPR